MRIEDQVCSLELSKKLKELGVRQESYFYWYDDTVAHKMYFAGGGLVGSKPIEKYSAYTASELGEMLPMEVFKNDICFALASWKIPKGWRIFYGGNDFCLHGETEEKESDARAKMIIYLIESNLLSPKTLNV